MGLRERKKAKTRRLIQQEAMRLFAGQGYDATTVDQIAEAAEISPSTFFRYFPTKEDVVIEDDYDPLLMEAFIAQPHDLSPVEAFRQAMRSVFIDLYETDRDELFLRTKLQLQHPALRARVLATQANTATRLAEATAQRYGRPADDLEPQVFAGAIIGAMYPAIYRWVETEGEGYLPDLVDECLTFVDSGLRLESSPPPKPPAHREKPAGKAK